LAVAEAEDRRERVALEDQALALSVEENFLKILALGIQVDMAAVVEVKAEFHLPSSLLRPDQVA
jgi:hypothetical protein